MSCMPHRRSQQRGQRRVRWTVTVGASSARVVEERRKKEKLSRSAMIDQLIAEGDRAHQKAELEAELIEFYSRPSTADEASLSRGLHQAAKRTLAALDDDR